MATTQQQAAMPALPLTGGCEVRLEAIDPTTGLAITGVTVSAVAIVATDLSDFGAAGVADLLSTGPFMLVPGPSV